MSKHTPGPWRFNSHAWAPSQGTVVSSQSHPICELAEAKHRQCYGGQTGYDGPLIAAAPELLAALREIVESKSGYGHSMWDRARAAIEKATGGDGGDVASSATRRDAESAGASLTVTHDDGVVMVTMSVADARVLKNAIGQQSDHRTYAFYCALQTALEARYQSLLNSADTAHGANDEG